MSFTSRSAGGCGDRRSGRHSHDQESEQQGDRDKDKCQSGGGGDSGSGRLSHGREAKRQGDGDSEDSDRDSRHSHRRDVERRGGRGDKSHSGGRDRDRDSRHSHGRVVERWEGTDRDKRQSGGGGDSRSRHCNHGRAEECRHCSHGQRDDHKRHDDRKRRYPWCAEKESRESRHNPKRRYHLDEDSQRDQQPRNKERDPHHHKEEEEKKCCSSKAEESHGLSSEPREEENDLHNKENDVHERAKASRWDEEPPEKLKVNVERCMVVNNVFDASVPRNEDFCRKIRNHFHKHSAECGPVHDIYVDSKAGCVYMLFDSARTANKASKRWNNTILDGNLLTTVFYDTAKFRSKQQAR